MITIYPNAANQFQITLKSEGRPIALNAGMNITFSFLTTESNHVATMDGIIDLSASGTDLKNGVVVVQVDTQEQSKIDFLATQKKLYLTVRVTPFIKKTYEVQVINEFELTRSQLFIKDVVVDQMREDNLLAAAAGAMREIHVSDDYIWQKLLAAESELAHKLRILLCPHQILPEEPSDELRKNLEDAKIRYIVETPYDYSPHMFDRDKWGYFITRQRPIIDVQELRFVMPAAGGQYFTIPDDWLRLDHKYGHVRILPTTNAHLVTASVLGFTALTWQSIIPNMVHMTYTAGLKNAAEDYPELIDAIKKMAVVKIITDLFLPQSGSISADGLSESMSTDVSKYLDTVDHIINGEPGGNGGLMAMFNGIRAVVI